MGFMTHCRFIYDNKIDIPFSQLIQTQPALYIRVVKVREYSWFVHFMYRLVQCRVHPKVLSEKFFEYVQVR